MCSFWDIHLSVMSRTSLLMAPYSGLNVILMSFMVSLPAEYICEEEQQDSSQEHHKQVDVKFYMRHMTQLVTFPLDLTLTGMIL